MFQYVRVAAAVPKLRVADCRYNGKEMVKIIREAQAQGVEVMAFPELCVTGYTCGDLFFQTALLDAAEDAVAALLRETRDVDMLIALGMPVRCDSQLFNCAVVVHRGEILGVAPKVFLPNRGEFYEERWFSPASSLFSRQVRLCGREVPMGSQLLFSSETLPELVIGTEVCADLWCPVPPSSYQAIHGANLILNLSASNELTTKADYRRELVRSQSAKLVAGYVYVSAGACESTTDLVFSGHTMICENRALLAEGERFRMDSTWIRADIDVELLMNYRRSTDSFLAPRRYGLERRYEVVTAPMGREEYTPERRVNPSPFVPPKGEGRDRHCAEIFSIQCTGLAGRLRHTGVKRSVLAVSGGLDSTLALLCTVKAHDMLGRDRREIIGVTMPGFGTTDRTYHNALSLMGSLGIEVRNIDIRESCLQHMRDIGQDPEVHDVAYENIQARERTQVVMDIANMVDGLVVGTGDLSELALGFTTYNGDHMSMYNVNCSIPKTLVRALVEWVADSGQLDAGSSRILHDILDTPVSPELLPPDKDGEILQKTEQLVGPYELHDFFLYNMVRNGFSPRKILFLAEIAFSGKYDEEEILKWLRLFYRRFFQQQFKRSCAPDGPKVGSVALSPRGDWRMPSDASGQVWMEELEELAGTV